MSFIQFSEMKRFYRPGNNNAAPSVTIRNGTGYITKAVYGKSKPSTIDIQFDHQTKTIRLRTGEGFPQKLYGRVGHGFSVPVAVAKLIVPEGEKSLKIYLDKSNDGWWYGNYE